MRLCESERRYRTLEHDRTLKNAVDAYAIGQRGTDVLDTLARARVWSQDIGDWLPLPARFDRSTWTDILDDLVSKRLGNRRCLDCQGFFSDKRPNGQCFLGNIPVSFCPHCGSTTNEVIGRAADAVR